MPVNTNMHIKCFNPSSDDKNYDNKRRIFHYTSPQGLYGILEKSTIRFTDCQFLNDKSEYTHIKTPLLKAIEEIKEDLHNDLDSSVLTMLNENFETEDIKISGKDEKLILNITPKRYYVFCASTASDSLGMWNYYVKGGNYQGYNIGFTISKLLDCFSSIENPDIDVFYGKVIYKPKDQINLLKELLLKADQELEDKLSKAKSEEDLSISDQEIKGEILNYLENYRLFFKDESFSYENEYRFVLKLPLDYIHNPKEPISMGYDVRNGIMTPYCDLLISKEKTVDSIILSPMLESELAIQGLKRFLKHNEYSKRISIGQSKVPIRY